jgi:ATP-binding cassette, subfamily B, heavy metal transporter
MPGGLRLARFVLAGLGVHPWRPLLLALFIVGVSVALSAAMPLVFGALVGQLEANRADARTVIILVLVYCGFHLANGLVIEIRTLVFGLLDNRSFLNLSRSAYARALRLPYSFHLAEETGVTWQRVYQGAESGSTLLHHGLGGLVPYGSQLALVIVILTMHFGTTMAAIVIPVVLCYVSVALWATRKLKAIQADIVLHEAKASAAGYQGIDSAETVIVTGTEGPFVDRFAAIMRAYFLAVRRYVLVRFLLGSACQLIMFAGLVLSFLIPLGTLKGEAAPVESFVIVNMYILQLVLPLEQVVNSYFAVIEALVRLSRLDPLLADRPKLSVAPLQASETLITLAKVDLRRGGSALLRDIILQIPDRSVVAIVGRSGAGKSSLCHMMACLVAPSSGNCKIDGMEAHDLQSTQRWPLIGLVPQSVPVLDDTLEFNVSLGRGGDRDAVRRVLRDCQLDELLARIEGDLSVRLGDGGIRLSGGEAQRLGLARAIYPDPRILILDEATASLDSETEKQIFARLKEEQGRRTIIIVTHKLPLVDWADLILYLEDGEIREHGTHRQLLARAGGGYASLWRSQREASAQI